MRDIVSVINSLGGMARRPRLLRAGIRDRELGAAVRSGEIIRARCGWYTTMAKDDPRVRAVRVGGRLSGISALDPDAWIIGDHPLHVTVTVNAARLRDQWDRRRRPTPRASRGVIVHWDEGDSSARGTMTAVGLTGALYRAVLDESFEQAIALLDWALHTARLDRIDFERLVLRLPARFRQLGRWVDPLCESLPESLARTRLRLEGHSVRSQVPTGLTERIDLLVDDCVALEVDGQEFHRDRFAADRQKDMTITIEGFHSMRPTANMVFHEWSRVLLGIRCALQSHGIVGAAKIQEMSRRPRRSVPLRR
jgi:very-short-patch-repair endonuclease